MSRGQESDVIKTASDQNKTNFANAQNSYTAAQSDIGNFQKQLGDYAAANPFTKGGEFENTEGGIYSNVADSEAGAAGRQVQSQAMRTGQNLAGANATAEEIARQSTRDLSAEEAQMEQQRIAGDVGYRTTALDEGKFPVQAEESLYGTSTGAAGQDLGIQAGAAKTPGFWDTFGDSFAGALGKTLGGGNVQFQKNL
jgi:hypothetical protein